MAQHDYVIANQSGASFRADLNNALLAIVSNNSGASAPSTTYAYQWWADTAAGQLKLRNAANSAWITIQELDGTMLMEDGTAASPGLAFASDLDTGFFRGGANQLGVATNGIERVEFGTTEVVFNDGGNDIDFRIEGDTNANLFFVDAGNDRVGIGVSSVGTRLHIGGETNPIVRINTSENSDSWSTSSDYGKLQFFSQDYEYGGGGEMAAIAVGVGDIYGATPNLRFYVSNPSGGAANPTERMRLTSSGRLGIGSNAPTRLLTVQSTGNADICIKGPNTSTSQLLFGDTDSDTPGVIAYNHSTNNMAFEVNAAERARIDSSGRLLVGTSSARSNYYSSVTPSGLQSETGSLAVFQNSNNATGSALYVGKSRGTTANSNTVVQANDQLGAVVFFGADGTNVWPGAQITASVDGTPGANDMPGRLVFSTTADGASSPTERARIDSSGRLLVGTSTSRTIAGDQASIQLETAGVSRASITTNAANTAGAFLNIAKSRGTSLNSKTVVVSGDDIGGVNFYGADGTNDIQAASITAAVDGTPGTNDMPGRLVFLTTADGASSPTERLRIDSSGYLTALGVWNDTSVSAANVVVTINGNIRRSTSSIKYKTNVETLEDSYADAILNCRPVWYQSTCPGDNPDYGHWGFIAEEVAEIDPRLCSFKEQEDGTLDPEGVQYDRFVPHLLNLIKRQGEAITALQAEVAALKAQ